MFGLPSDDAMPGSSCVRLLRAAPQLGAAVALAFLERPAHLRHVIDARPG